MTHFLYGLTIHSIQSYIFQTNKLKEIAGASELVEQICTTKFAKLLGIKVSELKIDSCAIRNAAGNIRYEFSEEKVEQCKKVCREFPKIILEFAPGLHFSQAVFETKAEIVAEDFKGLEKLLTAQRNNPIRPVDLGYIAINRSRRTGLPSIERIKPNNEYQINDRATKYKQHIIDKFKIEKTISRVNLDFFGSVDFREKLPVDFEQIISSKNPNYSWLAVIHADGNNMGLALQNLGNTDSTNLKAFSEATDLSTKTAAQKAFSTSFPKDEIDKVDFIPFRPIIVGGDDLTIVCRADLALKFTQEYLMEFEEQTKKNFKDAKLDSLKNGITACAGIAFVKVNYPFHYAIGLAEKLCAHAKKDAKKNILKNGLAPSCLMFHKVQDSFIEDYAAIIDRELTTKDSKYRFDFGPYYKEYKKEDKETLKNKPTIADLQTLTSFLQGKEGNAIKSSLRQWLTDLHYNNEMAEQRMNRLLSIGNAKILKDLKLEEMIQKLNPKDSGNGSINKIPVYDWLTILSLNHKSDEND